MQHLDQDRAPSGVEQSTDHIVPLPNRRSPERQAPAARAGQVLALSHPQQCSHQIAFLLSGIENNADERQHCSDSVRLLAESSMTAKMKQGAAFPIACSAMPPA